MRNIASSVRGRNTLDHRRVQVVRNSRALRSDALTTPRARLAEACPTGYYVTVVTETPRRWVVLIYKVRPEPTAGRVSVWRKLKRMGALLLHDAAWVLPRSARTLEQFQWLASEITELGGEALLWEGSLCLDGHDDNLVRQFLAQVDEAYSSLLRELAQPDPDLAALSRRYQQVKHQDYFNSPTGERAREALLAVGGTEA